MLTVTKVTMKTVRPDGSIGYQERPYQKGQTPMDHWTLKELQAEVGGLIQMVPVPRSNGTVLVNEEGLLMGLPVNPRGADLAGWPEMLVGPVVFITKVKIQQCCAEPKFRGGRCDNCGTWMSDMGMEG